MYESPYAVLVSPAICGVLFVETAGGLPYSPALAKPAVAASELSVNLNAMPLDQPLPLDPWPYAVAVTVPARASAVRFAVAVNGWPGAIALFSCASVHPCALPTAGSDVPAVFVVCGPYVVFT